jgi:hypothetical protein
MYCIRNKLGMYLHTAFITKAYSWADALNYSSLFDTEADAQQFINETPYDDELVKNSVIAKVTLSYE